MPYSNNFNCYCAKIIRDQSSTASQNNGITQYPVHVVNRWLNPLVSYAA